MHYVVWIVLTCSLLWLGWRILLECYVWCLNFKTPKLRQINFLQHKTSVANLLANFPRDGTLRLAPRPSSHLFGLKRMQATHSLNLGPFCNVVSISEEEIHVQGNVNVYDLLLWLLEQKKMLRNGPDMDHLTLGGLYAGIGGGATSFRYGAFYSNVRQIEVFTSKGEIVIPKSTRYCIYMVVTSASANELFENWK